MNTYSRRSAITTGLLGALSLPVAARAAKEVGARSFLGRKAPELVVEKWIGPEPKRQGRWVLLDFWATWCPPCRKTIPELNRLHARFGDRLVIIGLSDEPVSKVAAFKNPAIEYFKAIDTRQRTSGKFDLKAIPYIVITDPEGIARWEGYPLEAGHELTEAVVEKLLPPPVARP